MFTAPGAEFHPPRKQEDDVIAEAYAQLSYYFSQSNLRRDKFLLSRTGPDGIGFVAIHDFETFNRMKAIVAESNMSVAEAVLAAAALSDLLEISSDCSSIRRRQPLEDVPLQPGTLVTGQIPNIYWCAVDMNELRAHPSFLPLPPPELLQIEGPETWHWVRQDDPLWNELHWGVLSTRHLQAILGFREPKCLEFFGLPKHHASHQASFQAYQDLQASPEAGAWYPWQACARAETINSTRRSSWSAQRFSRKRDQSKPRKSRPGFRDIGQVRCSWGSVQEAAALKSLLDATPLLGSLEEVGLAMLDPARLGDTANRGRRWQRSEQVPAKPFPPLMGASPDAMLRLPSGELAAVEVKNVCPFFQLDACFAVRDEIKLPTTLPLWQVKGPAERVPFLHLPQMQWEMFVTNTNQLYFVSASACHGVNIFVVQRDNYYVQLLLGFISDFYSQFVLLGNAPHPNFFWARPDYMELLELTKTICDRTPLLRRITRKRTEPLQQAFLD
mmetsp:Transcript_46346/g.89296  ORF Transcript_46346/g.89296 Transcript_46346/m.89296 type:complete len:500 (-) Transcript_46346:387-1886(-)